jgi:hypothetical protein
MASQVILHSDTFEESVIAGDILMNIGRAFRETNFNNSALSLNDHDEN